MVMWSEKCFYHSLAVSPLFQRPKLGPIPWVLGTLAWKHEKVRIFCVFGFQSQCAHLPLSPVPFVASSSPFYSGCHRQNFGALQSVNIQVRNHSRGNHGANIRWGQAPIPCFCYQTQEQRSLVPAAWWAVCPGRGLAWHRC